MYAASSSPPGESKCSTGENALWPRKTKKTKNIDWFPCESKCFNVSAKPASNHDNCIEQGQNDQKKKILTRDTKTSN